MSWETVSAVADVAVAVTAIAGTSFLVWDRFRPRGHGLTVWSRSHRTEERRATQIGILAASTISEPCLLTRIAAETGAEIALKPSDYSLLAARRAAQAGKDNARLEWKRAIRFTQRPRVVGGLRADGDYETLVTLFVRSKVNERARFAELELHFRLATDPKRVVKRTIEVRLLRENERGDSPRAADRTRSSLRG